MIKILIGIVIGILVLMTGFGLIVFETENDNYSITFNLGNLSFGSQGSVPLDLEPLNETFNNESCDNSTCEVIE